MKIQIHRSFGNLTWIFLNVDTQKQSTSAESNFTSLTNLNHILIHAQNVTMYQ